MLLRRLSLHHFASVSFAVAAVAFVAADAILAVTVASGLLSTEIEDAGTVLAVMNCTVVGVIVVGVVVMALVVRRMVVVCVLEMLMSVLVVIVLHAVVVDRKWAYFSYLVHQASQIS